MSNLKSITITVFIFISSYIFLPQNHKLLCRAFIKSFFSLSKIEKEMKEGKITNYIPIKYTFDGQKNKSFHIDNCYEITKSIN